MPRATSRRPAPAVLTLGLALASGLAACAAMTSEVAAPDARPAAGDAGREGPTPDIGLGGGWDASLQGLRAADQRVADVAYRLQTANLALCTDRAPQTGLVLQSSLQYSPRLRAAAAAAFHIDTRPSVEAVAAGSPGQGAGLRVGDVLLAINGDPVAPDPAAGGAASYDVVQAALAQLGASLADGPVRLTFERGGKAEVVTLPAQAGCAYDVEVLPGPSLGASADGRHVFITSAMVSYVRSSDMLALVLGHEYAHDVLHHHARLDQVGIARNLLGDFGSTPGSLQTAEREADYVGLYLTARAGYDISRAADFWWQFPGGGAELGWSHPPAAARAAALAATRDEIAVKIARGEPLVPNPATRQTDR